MASSVLWLRVVAWWFPCGRTGSRREGSRQSLRLVSCPFQALRPVLDPPRSAAPSFPLAMADEGQWKGMSLPKTREGRKNKTCIPIRSSRGGVLRRRAEGFKAEAFFVSVIRAMRCRLFSAASSMAPGLIHPSTHSPGHPGYNVYFLVDKFCNIVYNIPNVAGGGVAVPF